MASEDSKQHGVELYVSYRRQPDLEFNIDYYLNTHMPMVARTWGPHGMTGWRVVQYPEDDPSGLHVTAAISFTSFAAADDAYKNHMSKELFNDLDNYSNYPPEVTKATVLGQAKL